MLRQPSIYYKPFEEIDILWLGMCAQPRLEVSHLSVSSVLLFYIEACLQPLYLIFQGCNPGLCCFLLSVPMAFLPTRIIAVLPFAMPSYVRDRLTTRFTRCDLIVSIMLFSLLTIVM
jgi:hypothetical protein